MYERRTDCVWKVGDAAKCANYDKHYIRALLAMPWDIAVVKQCRKSADYLDLMEEKG